jgi:hypothetical protein
MFVLISTLVLGSSSGSPKGEAASVHSIEFKDAESCAAAAVKWLDDRKHITPKAKPSALCMPLRK